MPPAPLARRFAGLREVLEQIFEAAAPRPGARSRAASRARPKELAEIHILEAAPASCKGPRVEAAAPSRAGHRLERAAIAVVQLALLGIV